MLLVLCIAGQSCACQSLYGYVLQGKSNCYATISSNDESQLLLVGTSKDFGTCGTFTKQGNKCTNIINKSMCNKCKYHVMQEHKKFSKHRSELNTA